MNQKTEGASKSQLWVLTLLRIAIGWHFLYEGVVKLLTPGWTAKEYLLSSRWLLADGFHWMASQPTVMRLVDLANIWGLTLIGVCLILGLFTRISCLLGMCLLLLYYAAYPPFFGSDFGVVREGAYLIVDKNLVEAIALFALLFFPTGMFAGLDRFVFGKRRQEPVQSETAIMGLPPESREPVPMSGRRVVLRAMVSVPFLMAFGTALAKKRGLLSHEEKNLVDGVSGATMKRYSFTSIKDLKAPVPAAQIGKQTFSRLVLGGNLIGGWAHARDLIYVSKLVTAYHTRTKVFETFMLAEKCGVNTILTNPKLAPIIKDYWKEGLGKIQYISDCGGSDLLQMVNMSIDDGASACYVQGGIADNLVERGEFDAIAKALDRIRANGLPAGIGGHKLATVQGCVDKGLIPDFWVKTLHPLTYWSAKIEEEHDNVFCKEPDGTVEFMNARKEPWIAFKILAAGAYTPADTFRYALESGADFLCVGMYDFQVVENVNLTVNILNEGINRSRPLVV
ncbi:MAG: DoxX family protein [Candidatus Hydrogenedentes bacterium]|nr:DoxX family protein [Candidatus Hydrogenedentota bacterium]